MSEPRWTTDDDTGAKTLVLRYPVQHDAVGELTEITLRRPKLRDLVKAKKKTVGDEQDKAMYADLSELPPEVFDELDLLDWDAVCEMYMDFLTPPETGRS